MSSILKKIDLVFTSCQSILTACILPIRPAGCGESFVSPTYDLSCLLCAGSHLSDELPPSTIRQLT